VIVAPDMRRISGPDMEDVEVRKSARLKHLMHSESRSSPHRRPTRQWCAGDGAEDAGINRDYAHKQIRLSEFFLFHPIRAISRFGIGMVRIFVRAQKSCIDGGKKIN